MNSHHSAFHQNFKRYFIQKMGKELISTKLLRCVRNWTDALQILFHCICSTEQSLQTQVITNSELECLGLNLNFATYCMHVAMLLNLSAQFLSCKIQMTMVAAAAAKSLQSCPTLCDPMDNSLPGSSTHGIFQARVLEWTYLLRR